MSSKSRPQDDPATMHYNDVSRTASLAAPFPGLASDTESKDDSPSPSSRGSFESKKDGRNGSAIDLEANDDESIAPPLYSVFTLNQKRFIVAMAAMGGFFSAMSANIYFPALNPLAKEFHVTPTLINLTITGYQIFQGLAPLMVGDLADMAGRRPAYLLCFVIYIGANVGLAMCPNYTALFILRCMQSSGSSGTIALGSGVVADIADSSERGVWMGFNTAGSNIAPALGPVIGGLLAQYLGWRAIFWFLTIIAGVYLSVFGTFFPETSRNIVGNGSIPAKGWNMSLKYYLQTRKRQDQQVHEPQQVPNRRPLRFPNPLNGLKLLKEKDIGILLIINALLFSLWYCVLSTTPYLFGKIYHFDQLQIGLCYLPLGVGALCAPVINGNALDWNFRRTAAKLGMKIDRKRATDLKEFPIERCRLEIIAPFMFTTIVCNLIYGWVMHFDAPLPVALVLQFIIGVSNTSAFGAMNVLLVDLFPSSPSTVIASNNLCRCFIGAGATAVVIPIVDACGAGGAFTLFGGLLLLSTPLFLVLMKKGPQWRTERR
ncbi:MFS general substrate transporter, partial [Myriangium duriaei CBS 260.36]